MMNDKIKVTILRWWQSMFLSAGVLKEKGITQAPNAYKAQLKRSDSLDSVMLTEAFRALWLSLPDAYIDSANPEKIECIAAICAALVYVKNDSAKKFATMAGQKEEGDKSTVSELRFSQLQNSKTPDDFIRRLRRILQQVKGESKVIALAEDVEKWFSEYYGARPNQASKRISVQWAMDYYRAAAK